MTKRIRTGFALPALAMVLIGTLPSLLRAEETKIEKAGVAVGRNRRECSIPPRQGD